MSGVSFRHGATGSDASGEGSTDQGNAVFFDGHVDRLPLLEARRPEYWTASGTQINYIQLDEALRREYQERAERGRFVTMP